MWRASVAAALLASLLATPTRAGCDGVREECAAAVEADSYVSADLAVQPIRLSGGSICGVELALWAGTFGDSAQVATVHLQTSSIPGVGVIAEADQDLVGRGSFFFPLVADLPAETTLYYLAVSADGDRAPLWMVGDGCVTLGAVVAGWSQPWSMVFRVLTTDVLPLHQSSWGRIKAGYGVRK